MAETIVSEFEARRVERALRDLFRGKLRPDECLQVAGSQEGDWLEVRWELANESRSFVYPVEARVDLRVQKCKPREAVDLVFDLLAVLFEDHLQAKVREPFTGINWEPVEFAGKQVFLRGQIRNDVAESAGTRLLDDDQGRSS